MRALTLLLTLILTQNVHARSLVPAPMAGEAPVSSSDVIAAEAAEDEANHQIKDINNVNEVQHLTKDMAKFYVAMGAMTAWQCIQTGDPTICTEYVENLKEPSGYLGFILFGVTSNIASKIALTRGLSQTASGFLGLGAGMYAQQLMSDFAHDPHTSIYLNSFRSNDPNARKIRREAFNNLWKDTLGKPDWWVNQVPDLVGMAGAGVLSEAKFQIADGVLNLAQQQAEIADAGRATEVVTRLRSGLTVYRNAAASFSSDLKLVWNGTRLMEMTTPMGFAAAVAETGVYIAFMNLISTPLKDATDWGLAEYHLNSKKTELEALIAQKTSPQKLEGKAEEVANAWDNLRAVPIAKASEVQDRYSDEIGKFNAQMNRVYYATLWATNGLSKQSKLWKENTMDWKSSFPQMELFIKELFCGPDPKSAVSAPFQLANLPLLSATVSPYRITQAPDTCDDSAPHVETSQDLIELHERLKQACQQNPTSCDFVGTTFDPEHPSPEDGMLWQMHVRRAWLLSHDLKRETETASKEALAATHSVQDKMVEKYDQVLQKTLLHALLGASVKMEKGVPINPPVPQSNGVLGLYESEDQYWSNLEKQPNLKPIALKMVQSVVQAKKAAQALLDYTSKAPANRQVPDLFKSAASQDLDSYLEISPSYDDDEKTLLIWRNFVLQ